MFTGIVTGLGRVEKVDTSRPDVRYTIFTEWDTNSFEIGASIACSGCCLTVVEKGPHFFCVDASRETLSKTNLGDWVVGTPVNLERSLRVGDELGGHMVSGHVDGVATIESVTPEGGSHRIKIRAPESLALFLTSKGSVALNGVSLTVNEVEKNLFGVNIIPHTWEITTFGQAKPGDRLNIEVDLVARYVARFLWK